MTSLFMGLGASFDLAEDNATLSINTMALVDLFDWNDPNGKDLGVTNRATYNADVSLSQLLSPTTVAAVTYGFTHQRGTLQQTWNSVPIIGSGERAAELFPPDFRFITPIENLPQN